jgi:hypothetical protein
VIEAKFDTPSRKSRSKERFTIGFSLKHHALNLFLQETEPATPDNDVLPDVSPEMSLNKSTSSNDFITPAKQKVNSTAKAEVSNAGNNAMSNFRSKASNASSDATSDATSDGSSDASSKKTTIVTSTKGITESSTEGSKEASKQASKQARSFTPQLAQNTNCYTQVIWQRYVPARLEQFSSVMHSINKA